MRAGTTSDARTVITLTLVLTVFQQRCVFFSSDLAQQFHPFKEHIFQYRFFESYSYTAYFWQRNTQPTFIVFQRFYFDITINLLNSRYSIRVTNFILFRIFLYII